MSAHTAAPPPAAAAQAGRLWPTVCIVLASVLLFLWSFATWTNRQLLNTDNWVTTSGRLLENKDVRDALGPYLVDQLYQQVDVAAELQGVLPTDLRPLAGPAAGGLRQLAEQVADKALANTQVQSFWQGANRAAHEQLLKILEGGSGNISTRNGEVTLDLRGIVAQIASRIGLPADLAQKIPAGAAQLTVLRSNDLKTAQDGAEVLKGLNWVLSILAIGLYVLAVFLARGRRRRTVMAIGLTFALVGVLVLIARSFAGNVVVDDLVTNDSVLPAAHAVWSIGTSLLSEIAVATIFFGFLLMAGGWLGGPMRPAVAVRRMLAPPLREYPAASMVAALLVALAILVWHPFNFGRSLISALVLLAVTVIGVLALRRQTAAEFPSASTAELGARTRAAGERVWQTLRGGGSAVRGRVSSAIAERGGAGSGAAASGDRLARLERLVALRDAGALTDEEFAAEKAALMGTSSPPPAGPDAPTAPLPRPDGEPPASG
ncbi:MAG: SHOCT domain-containing protein [Solirubrobacteraceae bacterium]